MNRSEIPKGGVGHKAVVPGAIPVQDADGRLRLVILAERCNCGHRYADHGPTTCYEGDDCNCEGRK